MGALGAYFSRSATCACTFFCHGFRSESVPPPVFPQTHMECSVGPCLDRAAGKAAVRSCAPIAVASKTGGVGGGEQFAWRIRNCALHTKDEGVTTNYGFINGAQLSPPPWPASRSQAGEEGRGGGGRRRRRQQRSPRGGGCCCPPRTFLRPTQAPPPPRPRVLSILFFLSCTM